ncbi:hypothetical protein C8Q73DRAFT_794588 [Cubamyces lactineus]|nr:hypothetical protein C8Q73DRAFT_794588 [Cubamyces lactineus]
MPELQTPATEGQSSAVTPEAPSGEQTHISVANDAKDEDVEMTDVTAPANATPSTSTEKDDSADKDASAGGDAPIEITDVDDTDTKATTPAAVAPQPAQHPQAAPLPMISVAYRAYNLDVSSEASKLPLDVAIFNSAHTAGGDEKIRKYLQAVLVGGTALVFGMAHTLESRLQAIATPLVPNMEKVQIIPPPKHVDPVCEGRGGAWPTGWGCGPLGYSCRPGCEH